MSIEQSCQFERYLPKPRDEIFALLVDHPETWWQPIGPDEYSEDAETVTITPYSGGVCDQTAKDGTRLVWGTVLSIEAPLYLRLAWQLTSQGEAIADPAASSRVMMTLRGAGEGTRLEVVHSDFIRHGEDAQACRDFMCSENGWPLLLKRLEEAAKKR
ncbi:SRPBCC domain-containing protein [Roseibium sp.]|uniref:SRPBCC domain-containing protein n=1 Tax=Roseibium sp. TaxID=1936156 RepID=UPI003A983ECF